MTFIPDDAVKFVKDRGLVSSYGWHAKFNQKEVHSSPPRPPSFKTIAEFTPMAFRYLYQIYFPNKKAKTLPFMDPLNPVRMESMYGVPLGGIGCGTIGRGFKGEFCRSSLRPGIYNHKVNVTDQFIVSVFREDRVYQKVLSPHTSGSGIPHSLSSWEWGFPADRGHYIGLYPRSWTIYELPEVDLILICEQISPVIPHNYKDTCLPVGVFQWTVLNFHPTEEARVSITLTWRGPRYKKHPPPQEHGTAGEECFNSHTVNASVSAINGELTRIFEAGVLRGCLMETCIGHLMPCCFGVAAAASNEVKVTCCPGFQCKALCKVPSRGLLFRSDSADANLFSSSSTSSSESQEAPSPTFPRAHTQAPLAARFWKDLKTTGSLSNDNTDITDEALKLYGHHRNALVSVVAHATQVDSRFL